jgi:hypothetical protein
MLCLYGTQVWECIENAALTRVKKHGESYSSMKETPKRRITDMSSLNQIATEKRVIRVEAYSAHPFHSSLLVRYLKTTWTVFSSTSDTGFMMGS